MRVADRIFVLRKAQSPPFRRLEPASLLPDIDSAYSYLGQHRVFRPLQFFVRHRGVIHSLTLAVLISLLFSLWLPVVAFPFFLGYAGHLFFDSFSVDGVRPFWPFGREISGRIRVGGSIEWGMFVFFVAVDVFMILSLFV